MSTISEANSRKGHVQLGIVRRETVHIAIDRVVTVPQEQHVQLGIDLRETVHIAIDRVVIVRQELVRQELVRRETAHQESVHKVEGEERAIHALAMLPPRYLLLR